MAEKSKVFDDANVELVLNGFQYEEIDSAIINRIKEFNRVIRYEFSSYLISFNGYNNVYGYDIKNIEDHADGILRFKHMIIDDPILNDFLFGKDWHITNADALYIILKDYKKTKSRAFMVRTHSQHDFMIVIISEIDGKMKWAELPIDIDSAQRDNDTLTIRNEYLTSQTENLDKALIILDKYWEGIMHNAFKIDKDTLVDGIPVIDYLVSEKSIYYVNDVAPISVDLLTKNPKSEFNKINVDIKVRGKGTLLVYLEEEVNVMKSKKEEYPLKVLTVFAVI